MPPRKKQVNFKKHGGDGALTDNMFMTSNISTEPNIDPAYQEIGIVHVTDTAGINAISNTITGIANIFGSKGADNPIFDKTRNDLLQKLQQQIKMAETPGMEVKICNLRMDINIHTQLIVMTAYGTLLSKKTT